MPAQGKKEKNNGKRISYTEIHKIKSIAFCHSLPHFIPIHQRDSVFLLEKFIYITSTYMYMFYVIILYINTAPVCFSLYIWDVFPRGDMENHFIVFVKAESTMIYVIIPLLNGHIGYV
jgi:hypothetical protein